MNPFDRLLFEINPMDIEIPAFRRFWEVTYRERGQPSALFWWKTAGNREGIARGIRGTTSRALRCRGELLNVERDTFLSFALTLGSLFPSPSGPLDSFRFPSLSDALCWMM